MLIVTQPWRGSQHGGDETTASPDEDRERTALGRWELGSKGTPLKGLGEPPRMKAFGQVGECF